MDAATITEALRITFHGWYDAEEDDFEGKTFFTRSLAESERPEPFSRKHKQVCGFLYLRSLRTGSRALSLERGSLLDIILRLKDVRPLMWEDTLGTLSGISVASDPAIGLPRRLHILTPPGEAIALSQVRSGFPARNLTDEQKDAKKAAEAAERTCLAAVHGRICFDLYAPYVGDILHGSERIRQLVAAMYPVVILDEFQDTNEGQWRVVQALGDVCRLIALADPEQRIYGWLGADPARLDHFRRGFRPTEVDLSTDNHRSAGTEIALFGNDLLTGKFRHKKLRRHCP